MVGEFLLHAPFREKAIFFCGLLWFAGYVQYYEIFGGRGTIECLKVGIRTHVRFGP